METDMRDRPRRTILITGCSSGIGHACAHGMQARGWRVFATARKPEDLERLKKEGLEALFLEYADEESIAAALETVLAVTGGRLDALFNNGGYSQPGAVEDLPLAALKEQFDANFFGWHALTRRAIPVMRTQGAGRIVNNSSVLGLMALGFRAAYCASKFAVEGYTDALRIEMEGTGISVAAIEPGPIRSRINENAIAAFKRHIDMEGSVHRDYYRRRLKSLEEGGNRLGQLEPEAVLKALVHACESARPRPRYYVTNQTRAAATIRRLLPDRVLHKVVTRFTG
jgi:NAD(P)-dependent dehydrogenase (short-subunit alcohol dehydrogenase family)